MSEDNKLPKNSSSKMDRAKARLAQSNQAASDAAPEMITRSVAGAQRGAKIGGKVGSIIPGVGTAAGTAAGAAVFASHEQAAVGRESGDPLLAFATGTTRGGLAGGAINAYRSRRHAEDKSTGERTTDGEVDFDQRDDDSTPSEQEEETRKRKRRQSQNARQRVNESVVRTEEAKEQEPASAAAVGTAAVGAAAAARHDKQLDPSERPGGKDHASISAEAKRKAMAHSTKEGDHAADAFVKGFGTGLAHAGREGFQQRKAMAGTQKLREPSKGLPDPETVADGFGYESPAQRESWSASGQQAGDEGVSRAREIIAQRQAEQAGAAQRAEPAHKPYEPSIPIVEPSVQDDGPSMLRGS